MKISHPITRRSMLKGGAVALCLPWLETFNDRPASAAAAPIQRYMAVYFPNGTTDNFWLPNTAGAGDAWSVSPLLEPALASKKNMLVLHGVGNYSAFGPATGTVSPSHGSNSAGAWHCYDPRAATGGMQGGGISIDQVIAKQIGGATKLPSLQVGLSTLDSFCDGTPCAHSRSLSWAGPEMPMNKIVNPQAVFDRLVSAGAPAGVGQAGVPTTPDPKLAQTRILRKSVLDAVLDSATTIRGKLSAGDQVRVDQYLTSVRDLEKLVATPAMQVTGSSLTCTGIARPPEAYADMNTPPDYSRETHANIMIQLVTLAFACDVTRVISFMLDDARSDYVYSHVPMRQFNTPAPGMLSSPGQGTCGGYHGLQHAGNNNDGFASITYWNVQKANMIAQALASINEGAGTALDGAVIHFGCGMHGGNHDGLNLPIVLFGSGGGLLKQNAYMQLSGDAPGGGVRLADLHLTLAQKVFGSPITSFGVAGASKGIIPGILA
ncbi:MAG TPA: DUF1552 domain-containing protein [Polyangia bacterium]|jgi:hypothetical protein|nr:DUF1552 domain-containing protein [Polyangia bacterium]